MVIQECYHTRMRDILFLSKEMLNRSLFRHQFKKVMGVWKNTPGDITNQTTYLQKNIQEWNNLLTIVISQEIMHDHPYKEFYGTASIMCSLLQPYQRVKHQI